jgi:hypothetical protein
MYIKASLGLLSDAGEIYRVQTKVLSHTERFLTDIALYYKVPALLVLLFIHGSVCTLCLPNVVNM